MIAACCCCCAALVLLLLLIVVLLLQLLLPLHVTLVVFLFPFFFPYITLTLARNTFPMWRILNPEYTSTWRWALLKTDNAFLMHVLQFAVLLFCPKSCCCCGFCFWDRTIASSDCALPSSLFSLFSAADAAACCCCLSRCCCFCCC